MARAPWVVLLLVLFVSVWLACDSQAEHGTNHVAKHGQYCAVDGDCPEGRACRRNSCRTVEEASQFDERWNQRELQAQMDKERALLDQSRVAPSKQAERPPIPSAKNASTNGAGKVRVSVTSGKAPIFAACRLDERLIGGGCRAMDLYATISQSYPSHFDPDDTHGGRWNCDALSSYTEKPLEAYALCQSLGGS
jgi:hypothetical protein